LGESREDISSGEVLETFKVFFQKREIIAKGSLICGDGDTIPGFLNAINAYF